MPLSWREVTNTDGYKALPPDQQEAARQQYFATVVAPNVPQDQLDAVKSHFDSDTAPQPVQTSLQTTGDVPQPSFMDRLKSDFMARNQASDAADARYNAGQQGLVHTALQDIGNVGAGSINDLVKEAATSAWDYVPENGVAQLAGKAYNALPQGIQDTAKNVLVSAGNSYPARAAASLAGKAAQAYNDFQQNHPVAAADLNSVANIGGVLSAGESVATAGPRAVAAGAAALPVVQKAGQTALDAGQNIGQLASNLRVPLSQDVATLQNMGVRLTPGQRAAGSVIHATENKATSLPLTGYGINKAYQRGFDDFNRGVSNDVLSSIGQQLPDNVATGHDAISHVYDTIGKSYDSVLPKMTGDLTDQQFQQDLAGISQRTSVLPDAQQKQVQSMLSDAIHRYVDPETGAINGQDNKEIMRRLTYDASRYSKSLDPDQQDIGAILGDTKQAYSDMLKRNNPAELGQQLDNTDLAYAKYVRLEQAGLAAANNGGVFTPAQLMGAVRKTDGSVRKGAVARGDALMQDIAAAGQNVLPNKYPDSGTAGRVLQAATIGGIGSLHPAALAALTADLGGAALYSRPAQAVLRSGSKLVRK